MSQIEKESMYEIGGHLFALVNGDLIPIKAVETVGKAVVKVKRTTKRKAPTDFPVLNREGRPSDCPLGQNLLKAGYGSWSPEAFDNFCKKYNIDPNSLPYYDATPTSQTTAQQLVVCLISFRMFPKEE